MMISESGRASAQASAAKKPAAPPPTTTMRSEIIRGKISDAPAAAQMKSISRWHGQLACEFRAGMLRMVCVETYGQNARATATFTGLDDISPEPPASTFEAA